jgi:hypothetical protein
MILDNPLVADWNKIGEYMQCQTDLNTACEKNTCVNNDYKVGKKVLKKQDGILCQAKRPYNKEP